MKFALTLVDMFKVVILGSDTFVYFTYFYRQNQAVYYVSNMSITRTKKLKTIIFIFTEFANKMS